MITKTSLWKKIVEELKETERSKQITSQIMRRIKETPQNENKSESN